MCVAGHKGFFFHQDPKACDPEGVHGQRNPRWEEPEAELWKPQLQQRHAGRESLCLLVRLKKSSVCNVNCADGSRTKLQWVFCVFMYLFVSVSKHLYLNVAIFLI